MKKSKVRFWVFLAPALISFTIIVLIPTLIGFFYSLTDWNGIVGSEINFVGFQNFVDIFTRDDTFLHAFGFTALFSICAVILVNLVGFALALLVTQKFRGATMLRGIFFMPNLIGGLLLGFTWQFIFVSIFEAIAQKTGWEIFSGWLSNTPTGFIGLLILTVWQLSGYMMIVYIAQIQQIPESVKEAARIDGAGNWAMLKKITLPLMMPAFTIGLFLSISNSFKMFDQNLALTQGGPYKSTEMIALNIYNSAFGANEFGLAQAKAIIFLIVVAAIGITQLVVTKRKEVEM
ncbi:MAG TPA: sugar ABC transporter permease [Candidatus Mediterraneibacter faecavium]|uniref:Sugar ABC transporter permease n=1 Tax=Candidatus Mediterraneibacter faecavium TaxID=2838668 RepID=A0A9D2QDQ0_9FIRM|nr:sugar ABC transporter permease [Candidatus Mediterraneibacter faecavium]